MGSPVKELQHLRSPFLSLFLSGDCEDLTQGCLPETFTPNVCVSGGGTALSIWGYYVSIKPKIKNFKKNQSQEYEILNGPKKYIKWNIKIKIYF